MDRPRRGPVWEDGAWRPLPVLGDDVEADLCVVGLGGSGLSAVAAALDHGLSVVGVDARAVGGGAAGRNGGLLLAGMAQPFDLAVATMGAGRAAEAYRLTLAELDSMFAAGLGGARRTGSLRIAVSDEEQDACRSQVAALHAAGFPAEHYDGPEGVGVLLPTDGVFDPMAACRAAAVDAVARGARLFELTEATRLVADGVTTTGGSIRARHVVVCVDGRLESVVPSLAARVRSTRLQMVATAPDRGVSLPRPVYRRFGYDYVQQLPDGRVVAGGLRDRFADAEWGAPDEVSDEVQAALDALLTELGVAAPVTHRWAGVVAFTDDHLPVCGAVDGVLVAGAYSGTGNVVGRICGRALVELAVTGASDAVDVLGG